MPSNAILYLNIVAVVEETMGEARFCLFINVPVDWRMRQQRVLRWRFHPMLAGRGSFERPSAVMEKALGL